MSDGNKKSRIPNDVRKLCFSLFKEGWGYKKTATLTNFNRYTVREYLRRYKAGDTSWAERGPAEGRILNT